MAKAKTGVYAPEFAMTTKNTILIQNRERHTAELLITHEKQVGQGTNERTHRGPRWNHALLVPPGGRGGPLAPGQPLLQQLLHAALVDAREGQDVHAQVRALRGPRHLLERHVGVGVLLQGESKGSHTKAILQCWW